MAKSDREDGGGLSLRTLVIASAASLTAAMVTSRLFPPGTIYASALTPVIVAAVSEMLHKPADRVTRLREQRRTMVLQSQRLETARVHGDEPSPLRGAPEWVQGDDAPETGGANGAGASPPIRVHGRRRARRVHPKVWIATGVAAFAIAAAALTLPELIFGGSVATKHRTTFFGGGSTSAKKEPATTQPTTTEEAPATVTETVPAQTPPASTQTETTTTQTGTETAPSGGAPAPTDTSTSTTTAPGGAVAPLP